MFERFKVQLKLVQKILLKTYKNPKMWLATLGISLATLFFILWINNWRLLFDVLSSSAPLEVKWDLVASTPQILGSSYTVIQAIVLVVFSLLQGINLALLIKLLRSKSYKSLIGASSKSGLALLATIAGAGCGACGTSLLAPIVASLGSTSVVFLEQLGFIILLGGIGLLVYSIFKLSMVIASFHPLEILDNLKES